MFRYLIRRLIQFIPTLIGIYILTFLLMRVIPGDAAQYLEGDRGDEQSLAATRARLGLDEPLPTQFWIFFTDALKGDLGRSFITNRPVMDMIVQTFPYTAVLALCAMLIAVFVGVPLGIVAAITRNPIWDNFARLLALIGVSVPVFWLGIQLQILFGLHFRLLPVSGAGFDQHLVLPALTASFAMLAVLMRITRSTLLEVFNQDYIRTARGKGLPPRVIIMRHAVTNALLPIVTVWGTGLASLLSGTLLVEVIFSYPGMGRLLVDSIGARDYPSVQGLVITFALIYAGLNLLVDMSYPLVDPRIRY
ncbi:MAG: peptide ABC transporter permease [Chloroflexota bacterium]|nr:MAG: peptide ABC transporter permease [Chloroflexota bacterium]